MQKRWTIFRDNLVAGFLFLMPILILLVIVTKVLGAVTGVTGKVASFFGLKSIAGISATTIVGTISLILLFWICGFLMRISFLKKVRDWTDQKLSNHIPAYRVYKEMAESKLQEREALLPYESAAFLKTGDGLQPCFVSETLPDGRLVLFVPTGGNVKEGNCLIVNADSIEKLQVENLKHFEVAIASRGLGLREFCTNKS